MIYIRILAYCSACVIGWLLLDHAPILGWLGWPFPMSIIGCGYMTLCILAIERWDAKSLRNWLVLAFILNGWVIWGLLDLWNKSTFEKSNLAIWSILLFSWQILFWAVWFFFRWDRKVEDSRM